MSARKSVAALVLVGIVVVGAGLAAAQEFRGTIEGTVTDSTGGVLPGVTVTVTNTATAVQQDVVTDESGRYRVLYLNPGSYSVAAELSGFKKFVRIDNEVRRRRRHPRGRRPRGRRRLRDRLGDRRTLIAQHQLRHQRHHGGQQADCGAAARRRHRLHAHAPGARHHGHVRPALCPTRRQRQPRRHRDQRRAGWQRVHHRRISEHVERARRRVLAAVGRDRAVQGADQRVRRAERPHRGGGGQSRGEERDQLAAPGDQLLQPQRQPRRDAAAHRPQQRDEADARVQPLHRHAERTGGAEPHVLHGVVRAPAGCAARAGDLHRPDRGDATRRLQRVQQPDLRSGHGDQPAACDRRSRTTRSRPTRIDRVASAYAAYYPLPNRPGHGEQLLHESAAALRLQRRHGPRRSQLHRHQPSVRDHVLEQAPGRPLQLGAGCRQRHRRRRDQRLRDHQGLRLPDQYRHDRRLHVGAARRICCSTSAGAGRGLASIGIRRPTSTCRRWGSRRRRCAPWATTTTCR